MKNNLQVSFLPWMEFKDNINLGPIIFWPYYRETNQRIRDPRIKAHLDKYFKSYVDNRGKPVNTITVCSYEKVDFRILNDSEYRQLRNTVDILIFTTITPQTARAVCADNESWGPPSADVFELVTQNFRPGSDDVAVQAGSLLSGGWKIGEITFPKPWATGGAFGSPEEKLVTAFNKCFAPKFSHDIRERLFRSLEWFRMAHIEGGQVSLLSKLVMMATGFEILLQFPRFGKGKYFVEYIENNIASSDFVRDGRISHRGESHDLSLGGCWAWDFYELRSRIVHGDSVPPDDLTYKEWVNHLIVVDLIFWECLKRELSTHKCISDDIYSYREVHKALGWIR